MIDTWSLPDTYCRDIFWTAVIVPIFSTVFVALRFWCRIRGSNVNILGADDWVSLLTLCFCIVFSVLLAVATHHGHGIHIWQMTPELRESWFMWITITSDPYVAAVTGYKTSLLLLYLRIFKVNQPFKWACYITMFVVVGYGFSNCITQLAGCQPLHKFWQPETPGHCINYFVANNTYGALYVLTDLAVAILPIPMVWKLQMKRKIKWQLTLTFVTGFLAFIISMARWVSSIINLTSYDRFGIAGISYILAPLEVNLGLICACIPTLKPVLQFAQGYMSVRSRSKRDNSITVFDDYSKPVQSKRAGSKVLISASE